MYVSVRLLVFVTQGLGIGECSCVHVREIVQCQFTLRSHIKCFHWLFYFRVLICDCDLILVSTSIVLELDLNIFSELCLILVMRVQDMVFNI